jgi:hypothetical protein
MGLTDEAQLLEIEHIKRLKARYFRFVDTKDWDRLASLFTSDAMMFFPESQVEPVSAADGIAFIISALTTGTSIHHGHMAEIELHSATMATGIWAMEDRLFWDDAATSSLGLAKLHGYGHYHENYRKEEGKWRIQSFRLSRLWSRATPPACRVAC